MKPASHTQQSKRDAIATCNGENTCKSKYLSPAAVRHSRKPQNRPHGDDDGGARCRQRLQLISRLGCSPILASPGPVRSCFENRVQKKTCCLSGGMQYADWILASSSSMVSESSIPPQIHMSVKVFTMTLTRPYSASIFAFTVSTVSEPSTSSACLLVSGCHEDLHVSPRRC